MKRVERRRDFDLDVLSMPRFQLQVSIFLFAGAACSAAVFFITRPKTGKIALPLHAEQRLHDPFDVTQPDDVVDGEPIDPEGFWARVRA